MLLNIFIIIIAGSLGFFAYKLYLYYYDYTEYLNFFKKRIAPLNQNIVSVIESDGKSFKIIREGGENKRLNKLMNTSLGILLRKADISVINYGIVNIVLVVSISALLFLTKRASLDNSIVLGTSLGLFIGYQYAVFMAEKRKSIFLALFPEAIETMIRSVQSGAPISLSLYMVGEQNPEPIASVFRTMYEQTKLGVSIQDVLKNMSDKLMLDDFRFFAAVLTVQQEMGGGLVSILNSLIDLMRTRKEITTRIKTLSAEARISGIIVGALPIVFFIFMMFISPKHIATFFNNETGNTLFNLACGLMLTGGFTLWKMTKIKV